MLSVLPLARDSPFIRDGSWCASMRADNKINDLPLRGNLILVTSGRRVTGIDGPITGRFQMSLDGAGRSQCCTFSRPD